MDMDILDKVKIKVKITDSKGMQAMISVDFGPFNIKGFRIRKSDYKNRRGEYLWLTPPSYVAEGRYHPMFFSEDKAFWEKLEDKIYDAFNFALMEEAVNETIKG